MLQRRCHPALYVLLYPLLFAACQRESPPAKSVAATATSTKATVPTPVTTILQDVSERDPRYMIGISYPPIANQYPALAAELKQYADAARTDLLKAVAGLGTGKPIAPYELSLSFTQVASTPQLVAIAADGSSYTGGAHGNPLLARFVWLAKQNKLLTAAELIPDPKSWQGISDRVREQLHAALSQRVDADGLSPTDRAEVVKNASRMIDEGTGPEVANFTQFEPVLSADGHIAALRFVFAPYQVGPYSDGTQTVEVPADVLLAEIAPAYRHLFAGG